MSVEDAAQIFLSTPSARRATPGGDTHSHLPLEISIHALREEGDNLHLCISLRFIISIHALREEGDHFGPRVRGLLPISIHALREEGDAANTPLFTVARNFYPRPPRGGRPCCRQAEKSAPQNFYPRPPRGGRPPDQTPCSTSENFYPRPPRGGRHEGLQAKDGQA